MGLPTIAAAGLADRLTAVLFPHRSRPEAVTIAPAGLTTPELLFDAAAMDPKVVAAADSLRAEDLGDVFRFGAFAEQVEDMSEAAQIGAKSALRGYVGEMMVASRLEGQEVSLPVTSNNAGYDLPVEGQLFQVKCYRDSHAALDALSEHFENYPDIPVYVNSEVMPAVQRSGEPWAGRVFTVAGYDYEITNQVMGESLAAGADLTDLDVPIFAVADSAARNLHGWWKGSVPLRHLPWKTSSTARHMSVCPWLAVSQWPRLAGLCSARPAPSCSEESAGSQLCSARDSRDLTLRGILYRKQHRSASDQADSFERVLLWALREKIRRKRCKIVQLDAAIARTRDELDREWERRTQAGPRAAEHRKKAGFLRRI